MNKNSIYNLSQNDYMSASNAIGFTHHDPNRHTNNASGFPFKTSIQNSIGGNGPATTNQNDWMGPTKVYGFSRLVHGGRCFCPSTVGGSSIPPYQTNFQPRGSNVTTRGAGASSRFANVLRENDNTGPVKNTQFKPRGSNIDATTQIKGSGVGEEMYSDLKKGLKKTGKFLSEHNEKLKKSKVISTVARNALGNSAGDLAEMLGYGINKVPNSKQIPTVFRNSRLWTANYNLPKVRGPPIMYGNATLGLNTDLGINVQPKRQAYFVTGL